MHSIIKKTKTRKLFDDFKVGLLFRVILNLARPSRSNAQFLFKKAKKIKHPKMALRSQIDPLIKSFKYFTFNEEVVLKNSLVLYLKCFVNERKQSTTIHRHSPNKVDDS